MKQTKTSNCILLSDSENPLVSQVIVLLKSDAVSPQDEAVAISRAMVSNCMKRYRPDKKTKYKMLLPCMSGVIVGIIIGIFI